LPSSDWENALTEFLHVITARQFIQLLGRFRQLDSERVQLDKSLYRILFKDLSAFEDLPEQPRSTVDGYAVRAEDTFGASDSNPALLDIIGGIAMGTTPDFGLRTGQAAQIPTGGFLPQDADAVVMVEYTNAAGSNSIEVTHPVTARANVLEKGEDARAGEAVIQAGRILRPQEIGLLAALGITKVPVHRKPRVSVISSGDEVVPFNNKPLPGQIRDANAHAISALIREFGGEPEFSEPVPDNAGMLRRALENGLASADLVAISGGSSVGTRDLIVDVVSAIDGVEILSHGVAIRPGKPTLLADAKGKAIFGLPGHPVSALVVAQIFLAPFLKYLQGGKLELGPLGPRIKAVLASSIHSTIGLEEFVRVRLEAAAGGEYHAHPVHGKSGMLSTMVKADGIVIVPMNAEGMAKGETVEVVQF
jgi:molybdopterin molybdotransferase